MKRDILQMSIAAALGESRLKRLGLPLTADHAPLPSPAFTITPDMMADASACIDELIRLKMLKGLKP